MPSQPTRRVTVFYGHIASNIGDLAINTGTTDLIRAVLPDATIEFVLLSARKSQFLDTGMASFGQGVSLHHFDRHSANMNRYLADPAAFFADCGIEQPDFVLLAAGEHLFDYGNGENYKSLFWRTLPAFAATSLGIPSVQLPATFGPYSGTIAAELVEALTQAVDAVAARDTCSRDLMAKLVPARPLPLQLDPAFHIARAGALEERRREHGVVGLAMRSDGWGIRLSAEDRKQMTGQFNADGYASSRSYQISRCLIDHLLNETGNKVRIFVQTAADKALAEHLIGSIDTRERVTVCAPESVEGYIHELGQLDRVYTSRFHAVILALLVGTPAYAVYFETHGHKMPGLFEALGWPNACANGSAMAPQSIVRLFLNGQQDEAAQLQKVLSRARSLRQEGRTWLEEVIRPAKARPRAPLQALATMRNALDQMATELLLDIRAPAVSRADLVKLQKLCNDAHVILDYRAGPLAMMASEMPGKLVIGVSDDRDWVRAMRHRTIGTPSPVLLHLVTPTSFDPLTDQRKTGAQVGHYATSVWDQPFFRDPDLIMLAGSRAGACLATVLLRLRKPVKVLFDNYGEDPAHKQFERIVAPTRMIGRMAQFDLVPEMLRPGDSGFLITQYLTITGAEHGDGA